VYEINIKTVLEECNILYDVIVLGSGIEIYIIECSMQHCPVAWREFFNYVCYEVTGVL